MMRRTLLLISAVFVVAGSLGALGDESAEFAKFREFLQEGRFEEAESGFLSLIEDFPLSPRRSEYLYYRALSLIRMAGDPGFESADLQRAADLLRRSERFHPVAVDAGEYRYWEAEIARRSGDLPRALELLSDWLGSPEALQEGTSRAGNAAALSPESSGTASPAIGTEIFARAWILRSSLDSRIGGLAQAAAKLEERLLQSQEVDPVMTPRLVELLHRLNEYRRIADYLSPRVSDIKSPELKRDLSFRLAEAKYALGGDERIGSEAQYLDLLGPQDDISLASYLRLFDIYRARDDDGESLLAFARRAQTELSRRPEVLREFYQRIVADAFSRGDIALVVEYLNRLGGFSAGERGFIAPYYQALLIGGDEPRRALEIINGYYREGGERHPWLEFLRAEQHYRLEAYETVLQIFAETRDSPEFESLNRQRNLLRAYALYNLGRNDEALSAVDGINLASARTLRSRIHGQSGRYSSAIAELEPLVGSASWSSELDVEYSQYLLADRRYGQLVRYYQSLSQRNPALDYFYAQALIQQGRVEDAYEVLTALDSLLRPLRGEAETSQLYYFSRYYLGWTAYRSGRDDAAIGAYRELIESSFARELHLRAAYEGAWAAIRQQDYQQALAFIDFAENASVSGAGNEDIRIRSAYLRGTVFRLQGEGQAALDSFSDFRRRNPRHPLADDALFDYARILIASQQQERGIRSLEEFGEIYADSPLASLAAFTRARSLLDIGEYERAREAFIAYRRTYPDGEFAEAALYFSGAASAALDESGAAQLYWRRILSDYPDGNYAQLTRYDLAVLQDERRNFSQALTLYRSYLEGSVASSTRRDVEARIRELEVITGGEDAELARLWARVPSDAPLGTPASRSAVLELGNRIVISRGGISPRLAELVGLLERMTSQSAIPPADSARANYLLGRQLLQTSALQQAAQRFLAAAAADPRNSELASQSLYFALDAYLLSGQLASARAILAQLEASYSNSSWTAEARRRMAELQSGGGRN